MTTSAFPPFPPPPSDGDGDEAEPLTTRRGARRVICVGGSRGGVGKSLLSVNLAVYFAQLGKSVLLVDADGTGSNLHAHFGVPAARREPVIDDRGFEGLRDAVVATTVPGLTLLPAAHDSVSPSLGLRSARKTRWVGRLRSLPTDYLVIDVGPGHGSFAVDLMLSADVPICVTVPEPPAVEETFRFLRTAYRRRLRALLLRDSFRRNLVERALRDIGHLTSPVDLVRALSKMDRGVAEMAWSEATRLRMNLVINQTRVRTDLELGSWMSTLLSRHHGLFIEELGHIEQDDTVWLTVRRNKPLLVDSPTCKAARNIERVARRVLALMTTRVPAAAAPPPLPLTGASHYATLGITRSSSDEEIRRAYKRERETYASGAVAAGALLTPTELTAAQTRLDEAYDTLLDPVRRRAYDLSTFSDPEPQREAARVPKPSLAAEQLMLQAELQREIGPDTVFTGPLLRKVRESQGVEIADVAQRTRISKGHLVAIEEDDYAALPAMVYVRGFLGEVAKLLKLDPPSVQKTYLRRMRERGTRGADE